MFDTGGFPLVVSDIRLPDGDGLELMREFRASVPQTGVVLLTAHGNVPQAVEAMRDGACDYLLKPVPFSQVKEALERVGRAVGIMRVPEDRSPRIVGQSPALLAALDRATKAAGCDADVLIEAESGTGKELLARLIHARSSRRGEPFVAVNCAALPETLLESELFGHARGAFTGALSSRVGRFEHANAGTILLDEIGELPLSLQPKLLRVLQERQIERIGENRAIPVEVRVIATTNRSLQSLVEEGSFRLDLYYRLNVIPLTLPPLRERGDDVVLLARHFLSAFGRPDLTLSASFLDVLRSQNWPGNVRELSNLMKRAAALCSGDEIGPEFLNETPAVHVRRDRLDAGLSLREAERKLLEVTLAATSGNRTRAAEMLGVSLRTIRNKIRDYGLPPRRFA